MNPIISFLPTERPTSSMSPFPRGEDDFAHALEQASQSHQHPSQRHPNRNEMGEKGQGRAAELDDPPREPQSRSLDGDSASAAQSGPSKGSGDAEGTEQSGEGSEGAGEALAEGDEASSNHPPAGSSTDAVEGPAEDEACPEPGQLPGQTVNASQQLQQPSALLGLAGDNGAAGTISELTHRLSEGEGLQGQAISAKAGAALSASGNVLPVTAAPQPSSTAAATVLTGLAEEAGADLAAEPRSSIATKGPSAESVAVADIPVQANNGKLNQALNQGASSEAASSHKDGQLSANAAVATGNPGPQKAGANPSSTDTVNLIRQEGAGPVADTLTVEDALTDVDPTGDDVADAKSPQQRPGAEVAGIREGLRSPLSARIDGAMGSPRWNQSLGDRVLWLAAQNLSAADIQLDPPELGPLQVRVNLHGDQASVSFSSHSAVVRDALDASLMRLREMFGEQGLDLTHVDVSDQRSMAGEQGERGGQGGRNANGGEDESADEALTAISQSATRLVDHYV